MNIIVITIKFCTFAYSVAPSAPSCPCVVSVCGPEDALDIGVNKTFSQEQIQLTLDT
ncbi:hypothetical protein ACRRTK_024805 [Alexandromys fortis]